MEDKDKPINKAVMSEKEVGVFVESNKYRINPNVPRLSRCVDGRYRADDVREAPVAVPGGDAAYLMTAVAALKRKDVKITSDVRKDVLEVVLDLVGGVDNFRMHTDDHVSLEERKVKAACGCGHCTSCQNNPKPYELDEEDNQWLQATLNDLRDRGATEVELNGSHREGAVVDLESDSYGLLSLDEGSGRSVFVHHRTFARERLVGLSDNLVDKFKIENDAPFEKIVDKVYNIQLMATVSTLAKGLTVYSVTIAPDGGVLIPQIA